MNTKIYIQINIQIFRKARHLIVKIDIETEKLLKSEMFKYLQS